MALAIQIMALKKYVSDDPSRITHLSPPNRLTREFFWNSTLPFDIDAGTL
jgi:hypothetical protein